jgi:hypothetical protein
MVTPAFRAALALGCKAFIYPSDFHHAEDIS